MTIDQLLSDLETAIKDDASKMNRWRQIHRIVAYAITLTLITLPVALATKLIGESYQAFCLFVLTVLAAFEGMFRPAAHSARRRIDAADMTDLLWQYRSAVLAVPTTESAQRLAVHDTYRKKFQELYRLRGQFLVDASLAQRENDGAGKGGKAPEVPVVAPAAAPATRPAAPAAAAPAVSTGAPAASTGAPAVSTGGPSAPAASGGTNGDLTAGT